MEGLLTIFGILAVIVQLIVLYLFVRTANDLHFLRKEYEYLKCIHRLGEYSLAKGERIYQPGEKTLLRKTESRRDHNGALREWFLPMRILYSRRHLPREKSFYLRRPTLGATEKRVLISSFIPLFKAKPHGVCPRWDEPTHKNGQTADGHTGCRSAVWLLMDRSRRAVPAFCRARQRLRATTRGGA